MIVKIEGVVEGHPISLNNHGGGKWSTGIDADLDDGIYIVEMWATDAAGNRSHFAAALTVKGGMVCARWITEPFIALWGRGAIKAKWRSGTAILWEPDAVKFKWLPDETIVRWEVCECDSL